MRLGSGEIAQVRVVAGRQEQTGIWTVALTDGRVADVVATHELQNRRELWQEVMARRK